MQQRLLFTHAALLTLIAILYHYFGLHKEYFWEVYWWDVLVHALGGMWVALAGAWLLRELGVYLSVWHVLMLVLAVGLAWELFEYVAGLQGSAFMSREVDIVKDLFSDLLGGVAGVLLLRKL